jgi:hypothetical protein
MKSKLAPFALLIPAVVLAQPVSAPQQQVLPPSTMPDPPVNPTKAASALSTAKQLSSQLKGDLSSDGEKDCPKGSYLTKYSGISYCTVYS